jgi:hypothetical protein
MSIYDMPGIADTLIAREQSFTEGTHCMRIYCMTGVAGAPVARVEAASVRSVPTPLTETQPAELMFALRTPHMHASLVLLDVRFAIWAGFCICHDPCHVLTL